MLASFVFNFFYLPGTSTVTGCKFVLFIRCKTFLIIYSTMHFGFEFILILDILWIQPKLLLELMN